MMKALLMFAGLTASCCAFGDCDARVDRSLVHLEQRVTGALTESDREVARLILADLCRNDADDGTTVISTTDVARPDRDERYGSGEDTPITVLGVEFNKADPDSKGHERLKKKR